MNLTITRLAAQAMLGRRRVWVLLAFPIAMVALAALVVAMADDGRAGWQLTSTLAYPLVLPLVAILASSSVLGPEVDDGSIVYLLAKPINRHAVAVSKWVVAWLATMLIGGTAIGLIGLIAGGGSQAVAWWVAALVAGTAYSALFLALAAVTRHAVVVGLIFVLVWEGLLGGLLSGIAWLSIRQWGIRIGHEIDPTLTDPVTLWWACLALTVVTVGGVWLAGDRLRSFTLSGDD